MVDALLILTLVITLVGWGCHHSVRGRRSLFGGDEIWMHPLTLAGGNWQCDCQLELIPFLPLGRVKIWISCYANSRGTLAMLCIAAFISL